LSLRQHVLYQGKSFFASQQGVLSRLLKSQSVTVQFSLFLHPDQAQNTSSGMQGQEATAVAVIK